MLVTCRDFPYSYVIVYNIQLNITSTSNIMGICNVLYIYRIYSENDKAVFHPWKGSTPVLKFAQYIYTFIYHTTYIWNKKDSLFVNSKTVSDNIPYYTVIRYKTLLIDGNLFEHILWFNSHAFDHYRNRLRISFSKRTFLQQIHSDIFSKINILFYNVKFSRWFVICR